MFKITAGNYQHYKDIFETIWIFYAPLIKEDPHSGYSPLNSILSMESENLVMARKVLQEGLRDLLTMTSLELSNVQKNELNNLLFKNGLPSLYKLVSELQDTLKKVLRKDKIKNENEYYIVKEFLDDLESGITHDQRLQLENIIARYSRKDVR